MKFIKVFILAMLIPALSACSMFNKTEDAAVSSALNGTFVSKSSLEEATNQVGFDLTLTGFENYTLSSTEAMDQEMIQVTYQNGTERFVVRKANKVEGVEDISGDATDYESIIERQVELEDESKQDYTLKGNQKKINLVYWSKGNYLYSFYSSQAMNESDILDLVAGIQ